MIEGEKREIIRVLLIVVLLFVVLIPLLYLRGSRPQSTLVVPSGTQQKTVSLSALSDESTVRVSIGGTELLAEVAVSDAKKGQGLSGRDGLRPGWGMIFVFDQNGIYSFWNKDMRFPLDIIWMSDNTVKDISENLPVFSGTPETFTPAAPVNVVLEVDAGFVKEHNIKIGDNITWYEEK